MDKTNKVTLAEKLFIRSVYFVSGFLIGWGVFNRPPLLTYILVLMGCEIFYFFGVLIFANKYLE